ncbi:carnosine N-methyltransferase-like [Tripterygium wilfordii]|uniref:carnosine N-methyltransferase-like n=1 Tax=Tripterygium wilfordii TaxID=458696 RepID=UPI0018F83404|nr:carnosine N-methyltransferase-like [Tripterygium wilfordii]
MHRDGEYEDEERIRQRKKKLEKALEVKPLRRIISAYLNYPDAAEEDVKRYERSFGKLSPAHKALLSHYPQKLERQRRCIATNAYFVVCMLQAFEPPLDMSQDMGNCEVPHLQCAPTDQRSSAPTSERTCHNNCPISEQAPLGEGTNEVQMDGLHDFGPESSPSSLEKMKEADKCGGDQVSFSHAWLDPSLQSHVPLVDVDTVRWIIRNIARDWAAEGQKERDQCHKPILDELSALFPHRSKGSSPSCLVPGAGLGRLAMEISCLGFVTQGCDFSYYMRICSSFVLNSTRTAGEWTVYPWIHSNCNSLSDSDQFRPVSFPDIHPARAGITEGFSMCGGDFVKVYSDPSHVGVWDAVVTCFFIDTARNIVEYIEIISRILKDGGVWINLGPLLYHFVGQEDEMSIELSLEDVKRVALHYGFQFEKEETIETTYSTNPQSMMQNRYFAAFWTARKVSSKEDAAH